MRSATRRAAAATVFPVRRTLGGLVAALVCLGAAAPALHAQVQGTIYRVKGFTPVVIAAVSDFKYKGADAVIVRRTNMLPHDVILVKHAHANARFLADAIVTLRAVRLARGNNPQVDAVFQVRPQKKESVHLDEAVGWANTLVTTREMPLEGYGSVKQVIVHVPNARKR